MCEACDQPVLRALQITFDMDKRDDKKGSDYAKTREQAKKNEEDRKKRKEEGKGECCERKNSNDI
jgi:hypothetical protein